MRESPALKIAHLLRELGAEVAYHDPHVAEVAELGLSSGPLDEELGRCDVACVITAHAEVDYERVVAEAPLVRRLPRRHPRASRPPTWSGSRSRLIACRSARRPLAGADRLTPRARPRPPLATAGAVVGGQFVAPMSRRA